MSTPRSGRTPRGGPSPRAGCRNELGGIKMGSMMDRLQNSLHEIDTEVKEETEGVQELKRYLDATIAERDALKRAVDKQWRIVDQLDSAGSFDKEFNTFMQDVNTNYGKVRKQHQAACAILAQPDGFNYHAAFKKTDNAFSGSAYSPPAIKLEAPKKTLAQQKIEKMRNKSSTKVFCCVLSTFSDELEHSSRHAACLLQSKSPVLVKLPRSPPGDAPLAAIPLQLLLTGRFASVDDLPAEVTKNLKYTRSRSPGLTVRYFSDAACRVYVKDNFGDDFARIYDSEAHGSFRGDICRTALLLREGGFYMDLDFQLHVPLQTLVDENTTMMSVISGTQGSPVILNALIAVKPNSLIMHETLARIKEWYDGPREGLLGPLAMARALSEMMNQHCPKASLSSAAKPTQWPCGSENLRFYQEEGLGSGQDCLQEGAVVCPPDRAESAFDGVRFGIFSGGAASKEARLIGWSRYAACTQLGCGINGGAVSLLEQSIEFKKTWRAAQPSEVQ